MKSILYIAFAFASTFIFSADAAISFRANNAVAGDAAPLSTFRSASFFQTTSPLFSRANCVVAAIEKVGRGCDFASVAIEAPKTTPSACTAIVVDMSMAVNAGCQTVTEVANAVFATLLPRLQAAGYPLPAQPRSSESATDPTLILVTPDQNAAVIGGPLNTRFHAQSIAIPDSAPLIDLVIVAADAVAAGLMLGPSISILQEPGVWNLVFSSTPFQVYTWIMFGVVCVVLGYAVVELVWGVKSRTTRRLDQRTAICLFGLGSATMVAIKLTFRRETWAVYLLNAMSTFLFHIAFLLLIQLWFGIASRLQTLRVRAVLVGVIAFFAFAALFRLVSNMLWITLGYSKLTTSLRLACHIVSLVSQCLMGVMFMAYAWYFFVRRRAQHVSRRNFHALTSLGWLAVICFVTFAINTSIEIMSIVERFNSSVTFTAIYYIGGDIVAVLRALTILMVLGVRLPDRRSVAGAWAGWFLNFGDGVKNRLSSIVALKDDTKTQFDDSSASSTARNTIVQEEDAMDVKGESACKEIEHVQDTDIPGPDEASSADDLVYETSSTFSSSSESNSEGRVSGNVTHDFISGDTDMLSIKTEDIIAEREAAERELDAIERSILPVHTI